MQRFLLLGFIFLFSLSSWAINFEPIKDLAQRRVPWLAPYLQFERLKTNHQTTDQFKLATTNGKVIIAASSVNAAAKGLNYYLEQFCHRSMSHMGSNLTPVSPLPSLQEPVTISSAVHYRYALNYTTLNYTMAFYDWEDWQWELDWMALHGVNLMLTPIGTEAVWQETLKEFGFSKQEIFDFIPGPGFNAWWLMGNLEGWGGPITQNMIDRRTALQQNILKRMKQLGIEPVLQGFYGMVPHQMVQHFPDADIVDQGHWAGGFIRPSFLMPSDPLFKKMAKVYYKNMRQLYGKDIHFFGGDPFHEGGLTKGVDLAEAGKLIQDYMQKGFSKSTWILQGWQINPRAKLLQQLDKKHVLVVQLAGEKSADWKRRKAFEGTPFIWCTVNNYGDQANSYGKLDFFADEVNRIQHSPYNKFFKGIGIMPEGIHNNPVTYDLMLDLAWKNHKLNVGQWLKSYARYRYGKSNPAIDKAWKIFRHTIYSSPEKDYGLPPENILCARPGWGLKVVSSWGGVQRHYNTKKFLDGLELFLKAAPEMMASPTYQIDAIDFTRQAIANKALKVYHKIETAFNNQDSKSYQQLTALFLQLLKQEDKLLSLNPHFQLKTWLDAARDLGKTPQEKAIYERNARLQVTIWGPANNPQTSLHEYAAKEWSGLLRSYYLPRWQTFFAQQLHVLQGQPDKPVDFFRFEKNWVDHNITPTPLPMLNPQQVFAESLELLND